MALGESALLELLDALRAGDGVDLIRGAVGLVMQEVIYLEAADVIGAAPTMRGRSTYRLGRSTNPDFPALA